jgi:hypothetical protein
MQKAMSFQAFDQTNYIHFKWHFQPIIHFGEQIRPLNGRERAAAALQLIIPG